MSQASRREFLKRASMLSLAGAATPFALNLAAIGEAAAQGAPPDDYKALVCVFLYGGNDYANTVVPYDIDSHEAYRTLRPTLAYARDALTPTLLQPTAALPGGRQFALAPELAPLLPWFDNRQMGVLLNIGTLLEPVATVDDYFNARVALPSKLFSHNDQQSEWQSSLPEGSASGWGGRIGDLFAASNGNATFTCINTAGNAVFLSGSATVQYQISPSLGSIALKGLKSPLFGSTACSEALRSIVGGATYTNLFESEHARVMRRSMDANDALTSALGRVPEFTTILPPDNGLALQLSMVAKLIAARDDTGAKRQVFFVSIGGFDTHSDLTDTHPALLKAVADALDYFQRVLGADLNVAPQVTTFTASDFGRTLVSNGDGSDHGWGGMHFVLGGAVRGKAYYGDAPVIANGGPNDVGQGRLLPTSAVDQLAATLATWFGVGDSDLALVAPNLQRFTTHNLGFL
jgi:uncharacterized protein (DUF1501 family)